MKAKVLFSLLGPLLTWLLLGAPGLGSWPVATVVSVLAVFEWNLIWRHSIFAALKGNEGIYGVAASAVNGLCTVFALGLGIAVYYVDRLSFESGEGLRPWVYGLWILCLAGTWIVPLLSAAPPHKLPSAASTYSFEDPKP